MSESMFNIFGDHVTSQALKNVVRQPLSNNENIGKSVSAGPHKPNEPLKKAGETKRSFMNNVRATLPMTPMRGVLSPKNRNLNSVKKAIQTEIIYNDDETDEGVFEEMRFTKPTYKYDNYHLDIMDFLEMPEERFVQPPSPRTPSPKVKLSSTYCEDSDDCDYDTDSDSFTMKYEEDDLPDLF